MTRKALDDRLGGLAAAAAKLDEWRPASEVLTRVESVPTIFPQLDRATGVKGWPLQRVALLHGPPNHGKTVIALGLGLSWLKAGGIFAFIDAEHTTPAEWLQSLMDRYAKHPGFRALRPRTYEEAVEKVRLLTRVASEAGVPALIVVDSIGKLMPAPLLDRFEGKGKKGKERKGIDGYSGRAAQLRAAYHSQWLNELVPVLYHTRCSVVLITRETEEVDPFKEEYKIAGGAAPIYDSSLVCRVTRALWVRRTSDNSSPIVGERHRVRIWKTKIAYKEDKYTDAFVHTSNGVLVPAGYDRPRDLLELGIELGVVNQSGSSLSAFGRKWRGISGAVSKLHRLDHAEILSKLEAACREKFQ
jgi:recombination protein RecA